MCSLRALIYTYTIKLVKIKVGSLKEVRGFLNIDIYVIL